MPITHRVGSTTILALQDGIGPFFAPRAEAFPHANGAQWRSADSLDPGAVTAEGRWLLRFRCFAIRTDDGRTILVDAGIGPADSPAAGWAPVPGRLPHELGRHDISPSDVDTVVLTHLHTDHVGWAVVTDGPALRPYFPNARYILQRNELDAVDAVNPGLADTLIKPLRETGQLDAVDGDTDLGGPVRIVATPGHTPGHQSVLVDDGDELTAVTGDLLVHAIQLLYPDLTYAHEMNPNLARKSRIELLTQVMERAGTLATPHLTNPFLSLMER